MNAAPLVREHFPATLSHAESDAMVDRISAMFAQRGFGLWAVQVKGGASFVGFVGLLVPTFEAHFTPCVEVGWRLARAHQGLGYAIEAARAAVRFGFPGAGVGGDRVHDGAAQREVASRDGEAGHDPARGG
ncbi:MAG: GNAT family N-acetyltransferase [Myxococcota bacterium]